MKLKTAILYSLARQDLKQILDDLDIDGVDRRSADAMRTALDRTRRLSLEGLLGYLGKDALRASARNWGSRHAGAVPNWCSGC
jgi:hypothetical protein